MTRCEEASVDILPSLKEGVSKKDASEVLRPSTADNYFALKTR